MVAGAGAADHPRLPLAVARPEARGRAGLRRAHCRHRLGHGLRRLCRLRHLHDHLAGGGLDVPAGLPAAEPGDGDGAGARAGRDHLDATLEARGAVAASGRRRQPRVAQGLAARGDLQRAAGDGDADPGFTGGARLPEFRSHRHRQQHARSGGLAAGPGLLQDLGRALPLLPLRRDEGLQGRRAELRAEPDRARCRGGRGDRQRLCRAQGLAARAGAAVRQSQDRLRAGAAGPPRLARRPVQGNAELGVCRLLRHRHVPAQRVRRHHPARHDDLDPPQADGRAGRLGDLVHLRGHRAWPAHDAEGLQRHLQPRALRATA